MKNKDQKTKEVISAAAEQWLNLLLSHIEHKRQIEKHIKISNKNNYANK